jgi:hypothetical protein
MVVDPEAILAQTFHYETEDNWVAEVAGDMEKLEFFYEDDLLDGESQRRTIDRIMSALGLPSAPVDTSLCRVTPQIPADRIANLEDVRRVFAPTR